MKAYNVSLVLTLDANTKEEALTRFIESIHDGLWDSDSLEIEEYQE